MAHAKLSPSSAHRWLRCPGSIPLVDELRMEGKIPKEERSAFTDEGTVAHSWAAKALEHFDAGLDFDWSSIPDQIMASHVRAYYDLVTSKVSGDGQLHIEVALPLFYGYRGKADMEVQILDIGNKFKSETAFILEPIAHAGSRLFAGEFSSYDEAKAYFDDHLALQGYWIEETGTADAVVLTDEALYIIDLKYGEGVSVDARENDQLAIYAESFIQQYKLRDRLSSKFSVVPTIFQPRCREGAPVREWFTTLGELAFLASDIKQAAIDIRSNDAHIIKPSDKACRFCPAKKLCKHYANFCTYEVDVEFADALNSGMNARPPAEFLSEEAIARIAKVALDGRFVKWLNSVAEYALELRLAGKLENSGLKAVYSNPRRKWGDEDAAAKLLRNYLSLDEVMPRSIISPSQAEKLLKTHDVSTKFENKLRAAISKPQGQPTLALADDEREEVKTQSAAAEFGDVAQEDLL